MPFLSDRLIEGVLIFSLAILLLSLFLVAYAIGRRVRRERGFKQLDAFRNRLRDISQGWGRDAFSDAATMAEIRAVFQPRLAWAMEQALLERGDHPEDLEFVRRVAEDLGFVARWQRDLDAAAVCGARGSGLRLSRRTGKYLTRARSAENLGRIRHAQSWRLVACALDDPHPDVQGVALRSLAAMGVPESFPVLVERLRDTLGAPESALSERSWRAALGRFPVQVGGALLPLLQSTNPKLRSLAADILVEMLSSATARRGAACCAQIGIPDLADLESVGPEVSRVILSRLVCDEDAEVRARAATLLSYTQGESAGQKLGQLLEDEAWFVRLHAVRAADARKDAEGARLVAHRLLDANWRVRESAARALSGWGAAGLDQLTQCFLSTQ
ncbi:MAG: HEAT repeat domain-containing protein, partial [Terriglobia bacterium]